MKLTEGLKQSISRLLTAPGDELSSWAKILRYQIELWRFCARRLRVHNVLAMSSALSFRTIFALVPIIILAFLVLKPIGIVEDRKQLLRDWLQEAGLSQIVYNATAPDTRTTAAPAGSEDTGRIVLTDEIESLIERAEAQLTIGRVGPIGLLLLIWTALTLLTTMERSLNRVFEAPRSRSFGKRILLYWSAVTLVPLAWVMAIYLGKRLITAAGGLPALSWTIASVGWVTPIAAGVVLLAGIYKLMPNTHVRFNSAVGGAIIAVPIWMLARWVLALYVRYVGGQSFYGAMILIPLFLIWLNLSWWIFLFGAAIAHSAASVGNLSESLDDEQRFLGPWDLLGAVIAIAQQNAAEARPVALERAARALDLSEQTTEQLLSRLIDAGFVSRIAENESDEYLLSAPPETIKVSQVLQIGAPGSERVPHRNFAPEVSKAVAQIRRRTDETLEDLSISELVGR
ncbi:MAG: YhjD/YihY/BrkB family envelope integrity protein [Planctomycetota bacterium]|jgi:membrane protein